MGRSDVLLTGDPPHGPSPWSANGIPPAGDVMFGSCGTNRPSTLGAMYAQVSIEQVEDKWGGTPKLGMHRMYFVSGDSTTTVGNAVTASHTAGRIPWVSFKLPFTWAQGAAGGGDSWTTVMAAALGATDGPVWVCLHHEPEGDGTLSDWQAMQARLLPMFKEYANIATTIITMGYPQIAVDGQRWADMWPTDGKDFIDVWGIDPYNWYKTLTQPTANWNEVSSNYFGQMNTWFDSQGSAMDGVRMAVGEFGLMPAASQTPQNYYDPAIGKTVATAGPGWEYIQRQLTHAAANYERVVALCYYDYDYDNRFALTTDEHKSDAEAAALLGAHFPFGS